MATEYEDKRKRWIERNPMWFIKFVSTVQNAMMNQGLSHELAYKASDIRVIDVTVKRYGDVHAEILSAKQTEGGYASYVHLETRKVVIGSEHLMHHCHVYVGCVATELIKDVKPDANGYRTWEDLRWWNSGLVSYYQVG